MKHLGKLLLFLILFVSTSNAAVTAQITPNDVYAGDTTTYVLSITGPNVVKPTLSDICGNTITATASQTSITSVNGDYTKSYNLSYEFTPKESCSVPEIAVEVDGKTKYSNSVKLTVLPRTQDLNADFTLEYKSLAKELYVGEPFTLTLLLKQKRGVQVVDSKFIAPAFKGFWIKSEGKAQRTQDSTYLTTKVVYTLSPQREGLLVVEPAELKIASRVGVNNWGTRIPQVRWRTYYSNTIDIQVKALPQNVKIIGDLSIQASVEKKEVNPNQAVNVTLEINGSGNLEDIESFKPYVSGVNVFDEKIVLSENGLSQKIVFVSEQDLIIPVFELKYFDTKTQKVKIIQTKPIEIKISGKIAKKELKITRDESTTEESTPEVETVVVQKNNYLYIVVTLVIGMIIGSLMTLFKVRKSSKSYKKVDIKDEKVLLIKLMPYKDIDKKVQELVRVLENNIYSTEKLIMDKKSLKEVLKRYDIS